MLEVSEKFKTPRGILKLNYFLSKFKMFVFSVIKQYNINLKKISILIYFNDIKIVKKGMLLRKFEA